MTYSVNMPLYKLTYMYLLHLKEFRLFVSFFTFVQDVASHHLPFSIFLALTRGYVFALDCIHLRFILYHAKRILTPSIQY